MNWDWLQLAKWIEKKDEVSFFGAVFAEFQMNPIKLILFDSLDIGALCLLSQIFQNFKRKQKNGYKGIQLKFTIII